jgi:hypothetical protein
LGDKWRAITQNLEDFGIVRPQHAASNSQANLFLGNKLILLLFKMLVDFYI